jgi:PAS domain S-box-containing protein
VSIADVTERRQAEAALRESEDRFRNFADAAPVMIWVAGPDALRVFVNKAWLTFTGRTLEAELGRGWSDRVHPDDRERCLAAYEKAAGGRAGFQMEYRLRRADGEYRWVLDVGVPRFTRGGGVAGYIGSCVETSEGRRAREEAAARQRLESLGVLSGAIAHDFNNLLGSILADAELALAEIAAGTPCGEEIERIRTVAIRASEIVRELLIYAGQDKAALEPVDVSLLVEEMLQLLRISIPKSAMLNSDLAKSLPPVLSNAPQLRQVVMNLVINAAEAIGPKSGAINVSTSRLIVRPGTDGIPGSPVPEGDYLRLEVSDTGDGMPEEVQNRIFDPFFSTKSAGRGLGLAVVKAIVTAGGGFINMMSLPGQGTRFEILFPCARNLDSRKQPGASPVRGEEVPNLAANLLLVEDEDGLRLAVAKMLRKTGISVIEAGDGRAAIDLIRNRDRAIDVILLDMTIPGASSQEVFAEAQRVRPEAKVIVTTAYGREAAGASLEDPQVKGFIRKPYQFADLVQVLKSALAA